MVKKLKTRTIHLDHVDSTNNYVREHAQEWQEDIVVVYADYQSAGRGMGRNTWESTPGDNLLMSILVHPVMVPLRQQFLLSMAGAVALRDALSEYTDGITCKWPNDIYWRNQKISGTLIETTLRGGHIQDCIFGIGINVNQEQFFSSAPNPVSLRQILGKEVKIKDVLKRVVQHFTECYQLILQGLYTDVAGLYHQSLYRAHGFHRYRDAEGEFEAAIVEVEDNGHLILRDHEGRMREYDLKEVSVVIGSYQ